MVALSFLIQEFDLDLNLILLMVILVFVFLTGSGVSFLGLASIFKNRNEKDVKCSITTEQLSKDNEDYTDKNKAQ